MLSDRIKKFGVKAREKKKESPEEAASRDSEAVQGEDKSEQLYGTGDKTENIPSPSDAVKKIMAEAIEKSSSAQSEIIDTYVDKKLAEIDRKRSEKDRRASAGDRSEQLSDKEIQEDESFGSSDNGKEEIPLLLRYSAALQSMRSEAEEEKRKTAESTASHAEEKNEAALSNADGNTPINDTPVSADSSLSDGAATDAHPADIPSEGFTDSKPSDGNTEQSGEKAGENNAGSDSAASVMFDLRWSGKKSEDENTDGNNGDDTPKEKVKKPKRKIPAKSCVYAPFLVAVTELLAIASSRISISSLERRDNIYIALAVIQLLVYIIPGIFYCKLRHKNDMSALRLSIAKPDRLYFAVISALTLFAVSAAFKLLYIQLGIYKSEFAEYASYINISTFSSASDILYMIITFVFIPAVSKEFIFRSVIFGEYINDGFGYVAPTIISSVMYAMTFFRFSSFPKYFIVGMILSLTAIIADSVIISMAASTVYGLLDVFSESYISNLMRSDYKLLIIFITVAMLLLFITLFFAEAERLFFNKGTAGDPSPTVKIRKEKLSVFLRSAFYRPSFLVCAVLFLLGIIVNAI